MKDIVRRWMLLRELRVARARLAGQTEAEANASIPPINAYAIDISFDAIADPEERAYFMNLPTSFVLPPEAVDRLRAVAGKLLRQSAGYQKLLQDFFGAKNACQIAFSRLLSSIRWSSVTNQDPLCGEGRVRCIEAAL